MASSSKTLKRRIRDGNREKERGKERDRYLEIRGHSHGRNAAHVVGKLGEHIIPATEGKKKISKTERIKYPLFPQTGSNEFCSFDKSQDRAHKIAKTHEQSSKIPPKPTLPGQC